MHGWTNGAQRPPSRCPALLMPRFNITLEGDTKLVKNLDRAIIHAAKQTCIAVMQEAQPVVIERINRTFHVRGTWYLPSQRFGIHVRFTKDRNDLSARLETAADWLEEHETGEDRTPDRHSGRLTIPQVGGARPTIESIVPARNKARRILPNASLLGSRALIRTSGRPGKSKGKRFSFERTQFFMNRAGTAIFERLPDRKLKLFYTLATKSHIKRQSTVVQPTEHHVAVRFGPLYNAKLIETIEFRRAQ